MDYLLLLLEGSVLPLHQLGGHRHPAIVNSLEMLPEMLPEMLRDLPLLNPGIINYHHLLNLVVFGQ